MSPSVHSTGTTASAPAGIGPPVMIRADWPGATARAPEYPAGMSPTTGSTTGLTTPMRPATSSVRTA